MVITLYMFLWRSTCIWRGHIKCWSHHDSIHNTLRGSRRKFLQVILLMLTFRMEMEFLCFFSQSASLVCAKISIKNKRIISLKFGVVLCTGKNKNHHIINTCIFAKTPTWAILKCIVTVHEQLNSLISHLLSVLKDLVS